MGPRYTDLKREQIIMSQNPVEHLEDNDVKAAMSLIENGRDFGCPAMVRRGARTIIKIRMRQFSNFMRRPLKPFEASLLAERRAKFIRQIEENRNE